jgi:hypothetical protein
MKDWERIRKERTDITDYVIHWVRPKYGKEYVKPFTTLLTIIECGYLKPGFAPRPSIYDRSNRRPTIRGPYPAVSFTEQTFENFLKSCRILPDRYSPYGIALYKRALYQYGGRPVIYGSEDILGERLSPNEPRYEESKEIYKNGLPKDYQYLWVRYEPIPNIDGYVVDWTHEREWRCRVWTYHDINLGDTPKEGIPLLLPATYNYEIKKEARYLTKILVSKKSEKELLEETVRESWQRWAAACQDKYLQCYFKLLPKTQVIALDELEDNPEAAKLDWVLLGEPSSDAKES